MTTALADSLKTWKTRQERALTLEIALLKGTYILPWSHFLYAEGDNDEVRIVFATHEVLVQGNGLQSLLADLTGQRIAQLQEAARPDRIENGGAPCIREISVLKADERRP